MGKTQREKVRLEAVEFTAPIFFVLFFFSSVLPAWFMNMRRVKLFGPVGGGLGKPSRCARWRDCEPTLPAPARDAERRSGFGV